MKAKTGILTALVTVLCAGTAYGGQFIQDEAGIRYQNEDGSAPVGWFQDNGDYYRAKEGGYVQCGWYLENGKEYYLEAPSGRMVTDRVMEFDGDVYQFDENGEATFIPAQYSGWMQDSKGWWYRISGGSYPKNAWKEIDGAWYRFDENGYMMTGPVTVDGILYYLYDTGAMAADTTIELNGRSIYFDETGAGGAANSYKQPLVIPPDEEKSERLKAADAMADQILAQIVNDSMSQRQKAEAIYRWIKSNLRYNASVRIRNDWEAGAENGLRRRRGDCYTYYATSAELLARVGIPTIEIIRSTDNGHYWNLAQIDGAWYHFDACPRGSGDEFCLLTDAQIAYSRAHVFDHSLYPPTP